MILPRELINEVKSLRLNSNQIAVGLDICNDLYQRSHLDEYVPINKNRYRTVLGISKLKGVVRALYKAKIIKRDFYTPEIKSYYYRIAKTYNEFVNYNNINFKISQLDAKNSRQYKYRLQKQPEYLKQMTKPIKEIKWDMEHLKKWIANYKPTEQELTIRNKKHHYKEKVSMEQYTDYVREAMLYSLANIENKNWKFQRDKKSYRLHTNVTNMKTALFKETTSKFIEIDINNSQPFMLKVLIEYFVHYNKQNIKGIKGNGNTIRGGNEVTKALFSIVHQLVRKDNSVILSLIEVPEFKNEFLKFSKIVGGGKFYEYFMDKFQLTRDMVKVLMFEILFSKNTSYRKDKAVFIKEFPMINQFVEWMKKDEHNQLAIVLQRIESYVIIDVLCKRLVEVSIIPITKHDSIIIKPHHKEKALSIFKEVLLQVCGSMAALTDKPLK